MLKKFATIRHFFGMQLPKAEQCSQEQLVDALFRQRLCPHCHATHTLAVIPGSEAGAFDFDLACSSCATEYEVRPTPSWYKQPQEITVYTTSGSANVAPSEPAPVEAEFYPLHPMPAPEWV
jgi:hypothetical protein